MNARRGLLTAAVSGTLLVGLAVPALASASAAKPFHSTGSGMEVSGGPAGCQFGGTCTVTTTGTATSSSLGSGPYTSTLAINYGLVIFPTADSFCAPASGPTTLTAANGDTVTLQDNGNVCGGTGAGDSHTFTGSYTVTSGTGRFTGATGSGTVSASDDGQGNSTFEAQGTLGY